jgi:hypothetical protein
MTFIACAAALNLTNHLRPQTIPEQLAHASEVWIAPQERGASNRFSRDSAVTTNPAPCKSKFPRRGPPVPEPPEKNGRSPSAPFRNSRLSARRVSRAPWRGVGNDLHRIGGVVPQIVNVSMKINGLDQTESGAIVDVELALAAGGKKLLGLRRVDHSLRIRDPSDAVGADTGANVDHFHAVVPERSDDQSISPVEAKMVEASLDTRHRNRFGQNQRSRCFGRGRFLSAQTKGERASERTSKAGLKSAFHRVMGGKRKIVVFARPLYSNSLDASKAQ